MAEEKKEKTSEKKKEVEIPKKFKDLVEKIEKLSVLELSELVKVLEEKFRVSSTAPVVAGSAPQQTSETSKEAEEKTEFDVELKAPGESKIAVIKLVREITGFGLKEAKDLVDEAPKVIKEKIAKEEAEELKKKLEEAGASVELK